MLRGETSKVQVLQGHDGEGVICLEGAKRGNGIMRFALRKARSSTTCKSVWVEGAAIEAGKPERKRS